MKVCRERGQLSLFAAPYTVQVGICGIGRFQSAKHLETARRTGAGCENTTAPWTALTRISVLYWG